MKTYLIDTFNLIHKDRDSANIFKSDINSGIASVISKIGMFANRYKSYRFKLILDGKNYVFSNPYSNIKAVESKEINADLKIKQLIDESKNKKNLVIISSDTEVYNYARVNACAKLTSEEFLKKINPDNISTETKSGIKKIKGEKPTRPTKKEFNEFLDIFTNQ